MKAANIQKGVTFTGIATVLAIAGVGFLISPAAAQVVGGQGSQIQGNRGGTIINAERGMVQNGGIIVGGTGNETQYGGCIVGGTRNETQQGGIIIGGTHNLIEGGGAILGGGSNNYASAGAIILGCTHETLGGAGKVALCGSYTGYTPAQVAAAVEAAQSQVQQGAESRVSCSAATTVTASAPAPVSSPVLADAPAFDRDRGRPEDQKSREAKRLNDKTAHDEARHAREQAKIAKEEQKKLVATAHASTTKTDQKTIDKEQMVRDSLAK